MSSWQEIGGGWVLIPKRPLGIIHFLGGAFVATAPQITYRWLLEELAQAGYGIVATPFINTLDHKLIARQMLNRLENIRERLGVTYVPIYGLGHSMGCKLHLLIGSLYQVERAGNILMCFNNYPAAQAIPLVQQLDLTSTIDIEFRPSPRETEELIMSSYEIRRNLLVRFTKDDIDQTDNLRKILKNRYPDMLAYLNLPGNHLTPLGQELSWQVGEVFTPLDAFGQWLKQEFSKDLYQLKQAILQWLNPTARIC